MMNAVVPERQMSGPARYSMVGRAGLLCVALSFLSGCLLPAAAPTSRELTTQTEGSRFPFALIKVGANSVSSIQASRPSFGPKFASAKYVPSNVIRPGDTLSVTIYETGGSSLFPSAESRVAAGNMTTGAASPMPAGAASASTIPMQIVEADGTISVPFVGRVKAAGLTPGQVGSVIEKELRSKAVGPQVVVTSGASSAHAATVSGEVNAAKLVTLSLRGERLLDVVAAAGGPKFPAYESYVHVVRQNQVGTMMLASVVSNPTENIMIRPGDQVFVTRNPRTYVVMGATQRPSTFIFDRERITLAEAIAQAGGPIDSVGDPSGIYLFRYEPRQVAQRFLDPAELENISPGGSEYVPILYQVDLRSAEGYFVAQAIQMRDKDVVLITNAEGTQLQKTLAIVRGFTGIAYDLKRQYTW
jgi:polysaccharide export outer membrane protein